MSNQPSCTPTPRPIRTIFDAFIHETRAAWREFENKITPWIEDLRELRRLLGDAKNEQRAMLKAGYLPSRPLVLWRRASNDYGFRSVALMYAEELGFNTPAGKFLQNLAEKIGNLEDFQTESLKIALRSIFPEIEQYARSLSYQDENLKVFTSIIEIRCGATDVFEDLSPRQTLEILNETDNFLFTLLAALDEAYDDFDGRAGSRSAFRYVPNRHAVCHGVETPASTIGAINALTLLYCIVKLSVFLASII